MVNSTMVPLSSHFSLYVLMLISAAAISGFILFYTLGKILSRPSSLDRRLQDAHERATARKRRQLEALSFIEALHREEGSQSKQKATLVLRGAFDKFFQRSFMRKDKIKLLFEQAGWPYQNAHLLYAFGKGGGILAALTLFELYNQSSHALLKYKLLLFLIALFVGWNLFDLILKNIIKKRVARIEVGFPNALDLMLICVGAGLNFQKSIERVAHEISYYDKAVAMELALTSIELEVFLDNRQALINLSSRVPSPIIRTFVTSLLQSLYQGTSIFQALDSLSRETREQRVEMIEEKVAKLPSIMVIPLVLFTLPNVFIILLGPSIVRLTHLF